MHEIDLPPLDAARFEPLLEPAQAATFARDMRLAAAELEGHTYWHVNSTASGGGVAEMLQSVLSYVQGGGVQTRWLVLDGDDEFFAITKRIHHFLHGSEGDGGALGAHEWAAYSATLERQVDELSAAVSPGDVVVLHDPQTVGFAPMLRKLGAGVIWSCHVGTDTPNDSSATAWQFLAPSAVEAHHVVFSRSTYAWDVFDPTAVAIIPPCIDAFSPKNQFLEPGTVRAILARSGLLPDAVDGPPSFHRQNGTQALADARVEMTEETHIEPDAPLVVQISRWDPLKDHKGVMEGFSRFVPAHLGAHLVLAGPSPDSISDDPEGAETLAELCECWQQLPTELRQRVHIACLPMDDLDENAAIVNALQRRADVVVQKSLAEGFGLTVAEAMWKETPTVASPVGGIQDQIENDVSGVLIDAADDLAGLGRAVTGLLEDPRAAKKLGQAARASVRDNYLAPCYLARFLELALAVH